jgi:hypothetical protein
MLAISLIIAIGLFCIGGCALFWTGSVRGAICLVIGLLGIIALANKML